jgi:hypothetical protein
VLSKKSSAKTYASPSGKLERVDALMSTHGIPNKPQWELFNYVLVFQMRV